MLAHQALLPLVLLLAAASTASPHLPSTLDRSRIRSVHRRHHARRAQVPCDTADNGGSAPMARSLPGDAALLQRISGNTSLLLAGRQESEGSAMEAVAETVKDVVEDVITPAISKGMQVSASTEQASESDPDTVFTGDSVPQAAPSTSGGSTSTSSNSIDANVYAAAPATGSGATSCTHGEWRCDGMTLKRCNWNEWNVVNVCSGTNIVCSDRSPIGCVWSWSVSPQAVPIAPPAPSASSSSTSATATAAAAPTTFKASAPSPSATTTRAASTTPSPATTAPKPSSSTITNEDGEECEEWEEEVWVEEDVSASSTSTASLTQKASVSSTATATATAPPTASPTSKASATPSPSSGVSDDDDCEEWEDETSSSTSSASATTTKQIGQNLAASPSQTASSTRTTTTASSSSATTTFATTTSEGLITQHAIAATISASSDVLSNLTNPSKTLSVIDVNTISISSITTTSSATQGVITGTASGVASYSAPHYVIYSDYWLFSMPDVSTLKAFNRFILAFWMSDQGPVDNAQMWVWMAQADRRKVLDAYHNAGIALMVSAFGSTDQPTTWGKDPIATAQGLAKFVIAYELDGVDIDYEDMGAMNSDKAEAWLIPFQKELRRLLPKPYLISHAPVAPWFTSSNVYRSGAYVAIHQSVGDGIDFYNMQFYNQGDGVYTDCNTLINQSGGYWPGTSVMEMNSYAKVPLDKIVIGKPLDAGKADNGYMSPESLNACVKMARGKGWNGGVMFWEWTTDAPRIMTAARAQ